MATVISVVVPCYNHGAYIEDTIESLELNVGNTAYELIIVNDGSTDCYTLQVLGNLQDRGYNVINQSNQGLAAARNNGIALAKGKYIIPLDSDNKLHENYLTKAITILEEDDSIDVVYGNPMFFGTGDGLREVGLKRVGEFKLSRILDCNYIDACAVYRKSMWEKVGGYDGKMPAMGHEDWEMWIHAFLLGSKFQYIDELCFYYRVVENSMLVTNGEVKHKKNQDYIFKKHSKAIVYNIISDLSRLEKIERNLQEYKVRSIAKLILGYKI
jgi:glycosyltransferase involved in cell wall biosynthesis